MEWDALLRTESIINSKMDYEKSLRLVLLGAVIYSIGNTRSLFRLFQLKPNKADRVFRDVYMRAAPRVVSMKVP